MKHLPIGGSSAARTIACPGWINACSDLKPRPPGPAAIAGSMHHEVQEKCQIEGTEPKDHVGLVYKEGDAEQTFTKADLDLSYIAFNAANELMDKLDIEDLEIEAFVQIIEDEAGGTGDLLGRSADLKTILVADYKFGQGVVEAKKNAQMMFIAAAARIDPSTKDLFEKAETIELAIIQPKRKGVVFRDSCTIKELDAFQTKLMKAIDLVGAKAPPLNPGPECKWCPAAAYCKVRKADIVGAKTLGVKEKSELQAAADILEEVEDWVNAVKSELFTQLNRGVAFTGWKIVDKRATNKWKDAAKAKAALIRHKFDPELYEITTMMTAPQVLASFKSATVDKTKTTGRAKFDLDDL
ncbi:MAG: DUF2800 domain-containing protein, partial [Alphaproteobacteria bacterium]|nr:DUF2800 domain-containing protein [Alphaproteobacteria bacterium]